MEKVLEDYRNAPISEAERALLEFVERVNSDASAIRREHVEKAKQAGWTEEALYDAITVCGLFNLFNRWCDASGVHDLPAAAYKISGKHTAHRGYTHEL